VGATGAFWIASAWDHGTRSPWSSFGFDEFDFLPCRTRIELGGLFFSPAWSPLSFALICKYLVLPMGSDLSF
jgi:hypothetical protein